MLLQIAKGLQVHQVQMSEQNIPVFFTFLGRYIKYSAFSKTTKISGFQNTSTDTAKDEYDVL